jgi:predicted anti-sigma-YlaC factor YlaD
MLTCKEVTEVVTDYLEGRQPFLERVRFELHLGMCRHCRAYLRQMRATIETIGSLPGESIPPEMIQQLLDRFRSWKR